MRFFSLKTSIQFPTMPGDDSANDKLDLVAEPSPRLGDAIPPMRQEDSVERTAEAPETAPQVVPEQSAPRQAETESHSEEETGLQEDPADDTLSDWPADALPVEIPPDAPWTPGGALGYARRRVELLPGQRRPSRVSPIVGTIAMWMGIGSAISLGGSVSVGLLAQSGNAPSQMQYVAALFGLIGFSTIWGSIILGTIGRQNASGRRQATIGRRIGCCIPMFLLALAVAGTLFSIGGETVAAIGAFLFALIVGNLILLIVDGILGTN